MLCNGVHVCTLGAVRPPPVCAAPSAQQRHTLVGCNLNQVWGLTRQCRRYAGRQGTGYVSKLSRQLIYQGLLVLLAFCSHSQQRGQRACSSSATSGKAGSYLAGKSATASGTYGTVVAHTFSKRKVPRSKLGRCNTFCFIFISGCSFGVITEIVADLPYLPYG